MGCCGLSAGKKFCPAGLTPAAANLINIANKRRIAMRKFIKDYLAKEYDNYVKDLEALTKR